MLFSRLTLPTSFGRNLLQQLLDALNLCGQIIHVLKVLQNGFLFHLSGLEQIVQFFELGDAKFGALCPAFRTQQTQPLQQKGTKALPNQLFFVESEFLGTSLTATTFQLPPFNV